MAKTPENIAIDQLDKDQIKTVSRVDTKIPSHAKDRRCQVMQCGFHLICFRF